MTAESWSTIAALAACVQTIIVAIAAIYVLRQVKEAGRARRLSAAIPLFQHMDSDIARQTRYKLFNELPDDLTALTVEQERVVDRVVVDYDYLAKLVSSGVLEFAIVASLYSRTFERCWRRTEPWVLRERKLRSGEPYLKDFEAVARRCMDYNVLQRFG